MIFSFLRRRRERREDAEAVICHEFVEAKGHGWDGFDRCFHRTACIEGSVTTAAYCWRPASRHWPIAPRSPYKQRKIMRPRT